MSDEQKRFEKFAKELEKLSLKHGVIIQSIGGVFIPEYNDLKGIEYSKDSTSGDLIPTYW